MWTAEVVLDLKETYDIKIGIIPPFEQQESRWPEALQMKYQELLFTADFSQPIYQGPYEGPCQFKARDQWLSEKSDASLLLMDEENPASVRDVYEAASEAEDDPVSMITRSAVH